MKRLSIITLLIVFIVYAGHAQTTFTKQLLLSGKIEISLPSTYTAVPKNEIDKEYPRNAPAVIYRDIARNVNFKIVWENSEVAANEVGQFKGWRVSNMLKDSTLVVTGHDLQGHR